MPLQRDPVSGALLKLPSGALAKECCCDDDPLDDGAPCACDELPISDPNWPKYPSAITISDLSGVTGCGDCPATDASCDEVLMMRVDQCEWAKDSVGGETCNLSVILRLNPGVCRWEIIVSCFDFTLNALVEMGRYRRLFSGGPIGGYVLLSNPCGLAPATLTAA